MIKFLFFTLGLIAGSVCGCITASLLTPKSGEEVRDDLRHSLDEIKLDYEHGREKKREELEADIHRRWGE